MCMSDQNIVIIYYVSNNEKSNYKHVNYHRCVSPDKVSLVLLLNTIVLLKVTEVWVMTLSQCMQPILIPIINTYLTD